MAWDKGEPHERIDAPDFNDVIRDNNDALEAALDPWLRFATGGTQSGQPRQGSARVYFQDSAPTSRLDGEYFDSTDLGCMWIDSNSSPDNQFNILTAADGAGTETWTPISTEIIAVLVAQINTWALAQTFSVSPVFTKGIVANDSYLQARNAANDGNVNMIKVDGSDVPTLPDGTALAAATESADGDRTVCDLAYAKTGDTVQHDTEGGYQNADVNGTKTKVYTKYLTGTLDADNSTSVAHGIASALTKILSVSWAVYDDTSDVGFTIGEIRQSNAANLTMTINFDATNVNFISVGAYYQGNAYRLKIDYIL